MEKFPVVLLAIPLLTASNRVSVNRVFNVFDYGAKGDGTTVDSAAVRAAFSDCGNAGGGTVLFPAHHSYLTGPFNISSNTTLLVEHNATILGNPDHSDWPVCLSV